MNAHLSWYTTSGQYEIFGLFEIRRLVKQVDNEKDKELVLTELPTIQRLYIQSISDWNRDFYIWGSASLLEISSDYIVKIIKPMQNISQTSTTSYATYFLNYKEKFETTESAYKSSHFWPSS